MWLVLLLIARGPAAAQAPPAAAAAPLAARQEAAAHDTARAIHRLFAARRQRRTLLAVGAVGAAAIATGVSTGEGNGFFSASDYAKLYGIGAAVLVALDFAFGNRYSRPNEAQALADFQNHRLSPRLSRKLKPRHFAPL